MALKFVLASLIVTAIIVVMTTQPASAADYSAAYALEANGKTETGKIENCNSIDTCRIKLHTIFRSRPAAVTSCFRCGEIPPIAISGMGTTRFRLI